MILTFLGIFKGARSLIKKGENRSVEISNIKMLYIFFLHRSP